MKSFLQTIILALFVFLSSNLIAQNGKITGQVIDKNTGETIIGGVVRIDGIQLATVTDIEGRFLIADIPTGFYSITVNFIGYRPQQITHVEVTNNVSTQLNFLLSEDTKELKEVEVVAKISRSSVSGPAAALH